MSEKEAKKKGKKKKGKKKSKGSPVEDLERKEVKSREQGQEGGPRGGADDDDEDDGRRGREAKRKAEAEKVIAHGIQAERDGKKQEVQEEEQGLGRRLTGSIYSGRGGISQSKLRLDRGAG